MGKIIHIVIWKLKPQSAGSDAESVKKGIAELKALAGPEEMHIGPPLIEARAKGFDYGLYSVFKSREALDTYAASEEHVRVVKEKISPFVEDVLAYDWEVPA